ncbi:MAG: sigma-54 dependent transcriptional regulator [Fuerstiella sp.]
MKHALVVDDEPAICLCFEALFKQLDCQVSTVASAEEGLKVAESQGVDIVVLDIRLPGMDGLSAIAELRKHTQAPVILMTAHGDLTTAVAAVKEGVFEYLPKPFELSQVTAVINKALEFSDDVRPAKQVSSVDQTPQLIGNSLPMQQLFRQIALAARLDAPVLITGESGTGKELVAQAIHQNSNRAKQGFIAVHLAAINEGLLERELFGHAKGAFTGAEQAENGLIAQADQGSLFLDEIGEASPSVQVRLLRALETGDYLRVGSAIAETSDFRLIAATNRPIEYLKTSSEFRQDFFYRLSTLHIHIPPLRDRVEDIPALVDYFLGQTGNSDRRFDEEAMRVLQQQPLPGNVRELRNVVVRATASTSASKIGVSDLSLDPSTKISSADVGSQLSQLKESVTRTIADWANAALADGNQKPLQEAIDIVERQLIESALRTANGNRSAAAKLLGIHRETMRQKMADWEAV